MKTFQKFTAEAYRYRQMHRPPAGWKSYGGYEKEPVEVDATAKRIDAIRKSIHTKKNDKTKGE